MSDQLSQHRCTDAITSSQLDKYARMLPTSQQQLRANCVCVTRKHKSVLKDICLTIHPGEMVSILGANGAGKSTFMSTLAGDLEADGTGSAIAVNGHPLEGVSRMQQARQRSVLPQNPDLSFDLDVDEVVAMGAYPYPEIDEGTTRHLMNKAMRHAHILELAARRYLELSG